LSWGKRPLLPRHPPPQPPIEMVHPSGDAGWGCRGTTTTHLIIASIPVNRLPKIILRGCRSPERLCVVRAWHVSTPSLVDAARIPCLCWISLYKRSHLASSFSLWLTPHRSVLAHPQATTGSQRSKQSTQSKQSYEIFLSHSDCTLSHLRWCCIDTFSSESLVRTTQTTTLLWENLSKNWSPDGDD
jgi:hypothetical protein